ncbi:basic leucine zipper transcriptional factor ATF-like 3 isoform X1 [Mytilus californianus]|uniref:basic leucine zipper transcriptional factor ATF-like 3 isoform X1 n=1 Tax=Mytilus californianus TaxID=6549 RepID=UPI00224717A9|nr:basic leucine zipper transcriptional factor ATF-like 3 isoform X1 [Mytilus californianus]
MFDNSYVCDFEENILFKMANGNNNLEVATLLALGTGNMAPLIKEELKCTIQSRRLAKGQHEMKVEFPDETKHELTEEERDKIVKRREQNRLAAQRFRDRKKNNSTSLCKKIQELEADNTQKSNEIRNLRAEKAKLQKMLYQHLLVCPSAKQSIRFEP